MSPLPAQGLPNRDLGADHPRGLNALELAEKSAHDLGPHCQGLASNEHYKRLGPIASPMHLIGRDVISSYRSVGATLRPDLECKLTLPLYPMAIEVEKVVPLRVIQELHDPVPVCLPFQPSPEEFHQLILMTVDPRKGEDTGADADRLML